MSVPTSTSEVSYTGNGVTIAFSVTFGFANDSDIVVKTTVAGVTTTKTLGVDYGLTGAGLDPGVGVVTFGAAPAVATTVLIQRTVPFTQATSFRTQGSFSPAVHEAALDKSTYECQQLDRRLLVLESGGNVGTATAGDGLSVTGTTWNVGAGTGITVDATNVNVNFAATTPANITRTAALAGVGLTAARIDHKHDVSTAAPPAVTLATDVLGAGTASTLARSDHTHQFAAAAAPANVTKSAAAIGVSTAFALSDHKHDVSTAAAVAITTANAEGAATSLARSDHTHDHGTLAGGDRHALAVAAVSHGFLDKADKTKLDSIPTTFSASASTTNAAITTLATITPADQTASVIEVTVSADRSTLLESAGYKLIGTYRKKDGVVAIVGAVTRVHEAETAAAWDCVLTAGGGDILLQVTGAVGSNIRWLAYGTIVTQAG